MYYKHYEHAFGKTQVKYKSCLNTVNKCIKIKKYILLVNSQSYIPGVPGKT